MGQDTGIEWTDATWNPVRGCSRVSQGCVNCYAEKVAARFAGHADGKPLPYYGLARRTLAGEARWTGEVRMVPEHLADPLRWTRPRRVFVNSMSDLFHEKLSNEDIAAVFGVMAASPRHTFQVLTKRAERMREWFAWAALSTSGPVRRCFWWANQRLECELPRSAADPPWPLPNVWLGVSVEDQAAADERIPLLLQTPAAIRFVSYEPALGRVDWAKYVRPKAIVDGYRQVQASWPSAGPVPSFVQAPGVDWLIVGGESGPGARPFDVAWARSTVEACKAAGVACFVKQLGARPEGPWRASCSDPSDFPAGGDWRLRSKKGGDPAEWPEDLRVRTFPGSAA